MMLKKKTTFLSTGKERKSFKSGAGLENYYLKKSGEGGSPISRPDQHERKREKSPASAAWKRLVAGCREKTTDGRGRSYSIEKKEKKRQEKISKERN